MKYRKKPVVIEAVRWWGKYPDGTEWPDWFRDAISGHHPRLSPANDGRLFVLTLEGTMAADKGDYIIQGVKGEIYPCKPDIFDATYEVAEATNA